MAKVRALFEESGLSLHELGIKMGCPPETARQAVWQFLRTSDPHRHIQIAAAGVVAAGNGPKTCGDYRIVLIRYRIGHEVRSRVGLGKGVLCSFQFRLHGCQQRPCFRLRMRRTPTECRTGRKSHEKKGSQGNKE